MSMCRDFLARCSSFLLSTGNVNMQPILKEMPWQCKADDAQGRALHSHRCRPISAL